MTRGFGLRIYVAGLNRKERAVAYDIVDADFVLDSMGNMPIIDVRPAEMFDQGHIPGAMLVSLPGIIQTAKSPAEEFAAQVGRRGVAKTDDVVVYCMIGQLAHMACGLLDNQGFTGVHCYAGSWIDWASDATRPVKR